ncbi:MAG TPA: aspartate aminotransferase family protein [Thermoanaerobaculia bacterium]|jgi:ornithine--oxo-acid transaminase|nr:aspartate aminotransferase family protein [Thermoanaerobaculia bacterium]
MQLEVAASNTSAYQQHVNPQWVRLLDLLGMNVRYKSCLGAELITDSGDRIVDFLAGYCVYNTGHNHPRIIDALVTELARNGPSMLQSHVPELAGDLAARLCRLAGGRLTRAFFPNSGSEGVDTAIKFSRAHTRRDALLFAEGGFHGLTCGPLSLMSNPFWKEGFGSFLPDTKPVPFGDLAALEKELATRRYAMFITEPIQAEAGIRIPSPEYLRGAQDLCRRYGTVFVLDEVQTGMFRTGRFLAAHHFGAEPDMVILAKALSGGLVPCAAVLMSSEISDSVFSTLARSFVHASTFSENGLAMRAAWATLDVLEDEQLGERADRLGEELRKKLRSALSGYDMVRGVRGVGMLSGIEFQPPRGIALRLPFEAFRAIHPGMFGQILVMRLFRHEGMLTQICGNEPMVLKVAPPLVVTSDQIDAFVSAVDRSMAEVHSSRAFWSDALGLARKAINI